jgi:hypothetical protein
MKIVIGIIVLLMVVLTGLSFTGKKSDVSSGLFPEPSVSRKHAATETLQAPIDVLGTLQETTPVSAVDQDTEETIRDMIGQALANKYNRLAETITLTVEVKDDRHVKGTVAFTDDPQIKSWYGVLDQGEWILVFDGMGSIDCTTAQTYDFPETVASSCTEVKR